MEKQTDSTSSTKSEIREELPTILEFCDFVARYGICTNFSCLFGGAR